MTQEGEVERRLSMCAYWTVYLGQIVLEFIIVIHFFDIDENCQGLIKSVGSNLFWKCIQTISYYSVVLCILVLTVYAAAAAYKRHTR